VCVSFLNHFAEEEDSKIKVKKLEPWNSVRVTISIPKEAAQKLRLLAQQGSSVLKSLGILTVQLEGDQVCKIYLRRGMGIGRKV
jgi:nuclear receptor coactivator 6